MATFGIPFEFFEAYDGNELTDAELALTDPDKAVARLGRPMTVGEIGCALSHSALYRKIVEEEVQHAVILEDDAVVGTEFAALLRDKVLVERPESLILLHSRWPAVLRWGSPVGKHRLHRFLGPASGATAYYLSLPAARRLLRAAYPIDYVADWPVSIHHWWGTKCIYPFPVYPPRDGEGESTLSEQRSAYEAHRVQQKATNLRRIAKTVGRMLVIPCVLSPDTFGNLSELKTFYLALVCRLLDWLGGGTRLDWEMPEDWADSQSLA
jgi:glycosyl transferase family 25